VLRDLTWRLSVCPLQFFQQRWSQREAKDGEPLGAWEINKSNLEWGRQGMLQRGRDILALILNKKRKRKREAERGTC
jgi:hypothetical protein